MKKVLLYIMVALGMVSMQSCLHDDKELFEESAAERLEHATQETKQILESSTSGWALQYYLGEEYSGGGMTYLLKFKDGKADATIDLLGDPSNISHSSYDVIKDQGPVLTFNTYNEWMHYFANPNTDGTTSGGDFEFVVMRVSNDTIDLKGRTTGNKMRLVRLPEDTDWETYLNSIADFEEDMFASYHVKVDGTDQGLITFDADNRVLTYTDASKKVVSYPYCVTPTGVVTPIALVDNASNFETKEGELTMNATDAANGKSVALEPAYTPDYVLKNIGSSFNFGDDAYEKNVKLFKADAFTYTSDADWLTVVSDENGLPIKATANNEGHPREATVTVTSEEGSEQFTVTQMEFAKDLMGSYALQYYDMDGQVCQSQFEVTSKENIDVPISLGSHTLHATLNWNDETNSFDWSSFQNLGGPIELKSGAVCYVYNIFVGDQYWSSTKTDCTFSAPVSYDSENGTYAIFSEGKVFGEQISSVYLYACNPNPSSSSDLLGYLDIMQSPVLVKLPTEESSAAKANARMTPRRLCNKMPAFHANPRFGKMMK